MIEHDLAFSSVASLRVLLVPVQPIKRDVYAKHCALIRKFTRIALRDVPVDPRGPSVAQLSAQPFSRGCVLFDYLDSYSKAQGYLEELQLSRRVVGVIGIVQSDEWQDGSGSGCLDEARSEFERLLGQHPQCLASRCYAFDPPEGMPDNVEGMVMVPSVGDLNFYISTLLADFAASILHELSNLASYLDTRTYVSTPRDPNASRPTNYRRSTLPELPGKLDRSVNIERTASATPPQKTRTASRLSSIGSGVVGSTTSDTNTAAAADKSTKRKMQARLLKLKADLRALAGRWEEASHMYDEAIQTFKIMSDDVWHASALENATMLAVIQLLHNSTVEPTTSDSPGLGSSTHRRSSVAQAPPFAPSALREQVDHIQEVVPLYTKALSLDPQVEDQTPPLLYAEACLRAARALHAVWTVGSWALKAVEFMVHPLATRPTLPDLTIPQRTSSSLIQRFSIADYVSRSITMHSITLPLFERLGLVSAAASLYSSIAYDRKRSSLLREAVALCSEAIMQAKKNNARQVAATSSLVKALPQADGNSSIMHLLRTVCVDVGIDLIQPYDPQTAKPIRPDHGEPEPFGWTELQVSVIKDAILSSRMLSDYPAALYFVASTLKSLSSPLGPEEQIKLRDDIPELSAAARRRGVEAPLDFWGPSNLIVSLELSNPDSSRNVHEHPLSDADPSLAKKVVKNPFIYNPKAKANANQTTLVQDEILEVFVTLQNPYMFELELESIKLSTDGIEFRAKPIRTTLSPGSFHTIAISGLPLAPGVLIIRGVYVKLADCMEREFIISSCNSKDDKSKSARSSVVAEFERIKSSGLQARSRLRQQVQDMSPAFLEVKVIPAQPLLRITSTSLTHGALMLYDGEMSNLQINVENLSAYPVDLCRLSFQDNHSSELTSQLLDTETDMPPTEAHELDWELQHQAVFSWAEKPESFRIEAGKKSTLTIQCYGKYGCMEGQITVDYSCLEQASEDGTFFTRKLQCPVVFTVHRAIDVSSLSFQPLQALQPASDLSQLSSPSTQRTRSQSVSQLESSFEESLKMVNRSQHCLVVLSVTNVFNKAFEVSLDSTESIPDDQSFSVRRCVEPGATSNLLVRLPRVQLLQEQIQKPVPPPVTAKQYVVSADRNSMSADEHSAERELFWYREELFKSLNLSWKEIGSRRRGDVPLRNLRLTLPMLRVLKVPPIEIGLVLHQALSSAAQPQKRHQTLWEANTDELVCVEMTLRDLAATDIDDVCVNLEVVGVAPTATHEALSPASEQVVFDGSSTYELAKLHEEETKSQTFRLIFLSAGFFALRAFARDALGRSLGDHEITVSVEAG